MEAESAEVRRSLWGGGKNNEEETDDMATTILGDVTHPTPIVINQPPQQSNPFLPIAAAGLLGLLGAGTGAAATAYLLSQKAQPVAPEFDDETLTIGLGRIENFTKASETQ